MKPALVPGSIVPGRCLRIYFYQCSWLVSFPPLFSLRSGGLREHYTEVANQFVPSPPFLGEYTEQEILVM